MLIDIDDDFGNELLRLAKASNVPLNEVVESGFKNSRFLKEDLLYGKDHFSDFIDEYLSVLSSLDSYQSELLLTIKEIDDSDAIQHVFKELFRLANEDIWLLNKLFQVYKQPDNINKLI